MTQRPGENGKMSEARDQPTSSQDSTAVPDSPAFDVLTMGRISVDLYPSQSGVPLADVQRFERFLGGSPTNVAVAAARLGRRSAIITKVGNEGFGPYVRAALRSFGVDDRFVGTDPDLLTPIVFCELFPPDRFPLLFYRLPTAPDIRIDPGDLDLAAIRDARVFWTTGTGLSAEPSRTATLTALEARARKTFTVHDLDYRPTLWPQPEEAGALQQRALRSATVAVGNLEEVKIAIGEGAPFELARRLLDFGPELAIVKLGGGGVVVAWADEVHQVRPLSVEVVNGLGAGDAFGGAVCHGLLAGWAPAEIVRFANAAGAIVASRLACADAMPEESEVRALLNATGQSGSRAIGRPGTASEGKSGEATEGDSGAIVDGEH
jgi:5-dehydro-2-deoxygluconokinase